MAWEEEAWPGEAQGKLRREAAEEDQKEVWRQRRHSGRR